MSGYAGKILHANLDEGSFAEETPNEQFYRKYIGGASLSAYYLLKKMKSGVDALDPANVMV